MNARFLAVFLAVLAVVGLASAFVLNEHEKSLERVCDNGGTCDTPVPVPPRPENEARLSIPSIDATYVNQFGDEGLYLYGTPLNLSSNEVQISGQSIGNFSVQQSGEVGFYFKGRPEGGDSRKLSVTSESNKVALSAKCPFPDGSCNSLTTMSLVAEKYIDLQNSAGVNFRSQYGDQYLSISQRNYGPQPWPVLVGANSDIEIIGTGNLVLSGSALESDRHELVLVSPNGSRWQVVVDDQGNLSTVEAN